MRSPAALDSPPSSVHHGFWPNRYYPVDQAALAMAEQAGLLALARKLVKTRGGSLAAALSAGRRSTPWTRRGQLGAPRRHARQGAVTGGPPSGRGLAL